jgi:hypothetical protein
MESRENKKQTHKEKRKEIYREEEGNLQQGTVNETFA